jgi:hypothetical protein
VRILPDSALVDLQPTGVDIERFFDPSSGVCWRRMADIGDRDPMVVAVSGPARLASVLSRSDLSIEEIARRSTRGARVR